jgi:hypothetical protein
MRKIINTVACALIIASAFTACKEDYVPDGAVGLESISLTSNLNSALASTVTGTIESATNTVTFVLPESVTETRFIPTFTATRDDIVTVSGTTVESGVTAITVTDGTKIVVSDEKSGLTANYTIKVVDNDERAELLSVKIAAADNAALLTEDVAAAEIAEAMVVRVPAAAFRQELTISFTATSNDVITVNKQDVTDGKALNVDTAFPIDIEVTDAIASKSSKYVLKVGKILEIKANVVAEYTNDDLQANVSFAMDAKNSVPFIAVNENNTEGDVTTKDLLTVLKYEGGQLAPVGPAKFSGCQTAYTVIDVLDGKPYVFFQDYGATSKYTHSVMTFDGGAWSYVGDRGFSERTTQLYTKYPYAMCIDQATKNIMTVCTSNAANTNGVVKRGASVSIFNGSEWNANKPINGRTQAYAYTPRMCSTANGVYIIVCNQTEKSNSVYKYADGAFSTIVADFWPTAADGTKATEISTTFLSMKANSKGEVFALISDNLSNNVWMASYYKLDEANNTFVKVGNPIKADFSDSGCVYDFTFDKNDNPVIAYIENAENAPVKVITIDEESKDWTDPVAMPGVANASYIGIGAAADGTIYVAYSTADSNKKNTVVLATYGLEDDVLPE